MDSFTNRMMDRATTRRVQFEHHVNEILTEGDLDDPNLEVMLEAKRREYREILRSRRGSDDCFGGADDKENFVGNSSVQSEENADEEASPLSNGYGRQRELEELDGCSPRSEAQHGKYSEQRSKRLAHLATQINNWEDESDKKLNIPRRGETSVVKPIAKPVSSPAIRKKMDKYDNEGRKNAPERYVAWDNKLLQNLETQGFQRCDTVQPLVSRQKTPDRSRASSPLKMNVRSPEPHSPTKSGSPVKDNRSRSPSKHPPVQTTATAFRSASPVKFADVSPSKTAESIAKALMRDTMPVKLVASQPPCSKKTVSTVLEKVVKFEVETKLSKQVKDPTELSIQDRMAIFERNSGKAVIPKAPFGTPVPAKILQSGYKSPERGSFKLKVDAGRQHDNFNGKAVIPKAPYGTPVPAKIHQSGHKSPEKGTFKLKVESRQLDDFNREQSTVAQSVVERQREIELLRDRWDRKREENVLQGGPTSQVLADSPTSPCAGRIRMGTRSPVRRERSPELSPSRLGGQHTPRKSSEFVENLSQIKKIKVSPPKPGRLYPSVSDIETDSEAMDTTSRTDVLDSDFDLPPKECQPGYSSDSEGSIASFGQKVVSRARLSQVNLKRGITSSTFRSTSSSSTSTLNMSAQESIVLHEMDDFLDEALGDASPPKRLKDITCQQDNPQYRDVTQEQLADRKLVHTVSTYRKLEAQRTPKQETHADYKSEPAHYKSTTESALVEDKIFELNQEMIKQTTIIAQTTQALNLCHARPEFAGSLEQVEAEKLLLIATSRRAAALRELERLKIEKTLPRGVKGNADTGNLTIEYISLPIKMCPTEPDKTDYFMCLVTSGVTVVGTQVLALKKQNLMRGNRLAFTKPITLENLFCDFTVTLEVYKLNCGNVGASGPSDVKGDKKASKWLTPQKKRHQRLPVESPGGPNSVRSPSFKMVGFVIFSLRELRRNKFTLNKVPHGAALDGTVELSMTSALNSEVEYRGFLTQFEKVAGLGAWTRKWALLKRSSITFWLYPEHEEQDKTPIDAVNLGTVKTREVGLVSREVCARPHTFLLETDHGEKLLSADTLDDRLAWTRAINKSLQLLRAWEGRPC